MPELVVIVVAVVAAAIGVAIGFVARRMVAANSVKHAEQYAERLVAEARAKQKEIVLEGKDEALHLRRAAEDEAREQRATLPALRAPTPGPGGGARSQGGRHRGARGRALARQAELDQERARLAELQQRQLVELERVSGLTVAEARACR